MDADSHWSSFLSSSNQGLDCPCGDGPCSCSWKSVIEGVPEPSSSAGRCPLHGQTNQHLNEAPYLFYRKITTVSALYPSGTRLDDPEDLIYARFEARRQKLSSAAAPVPLEVRRLCCVDPQHVMKANEQREMLDICGCLCIHTVGTRQSEKRQRTSAGAIHSDSRQCARPECSSPAIQSDEFCASHFDIKELRDRVDYLTPDSLRPFLASPGHADLCYWHRFQGDLPPRKGEIVAVLNGFVSKDTSRFSFLSVVPQKPWVEVNRPQNPADRKKHVKVAYLGHVVVTVSSLPADFDPDQPYSIYPSGFNDGRGKLLPPNPELKAVGWLNGHLTKSEDGQAWSVPVLVAINEGLQLPLSVDRTFRRQGLPLSPFPPEKRFDRSEFVLSLLSEIQALSSLENSSKSVPMLILHGPAGVGKSSVAVELSALDQIPTLFPSGVWTWSFNSPPPTGPSEKDLLPALQDLLMCLSPSLKHHELPDTVQGCRARIPKLAEASKLLILLDNLWFDEQLEPFLSVGPSCLLLVTSRNAKIGEPSQITCYRKIPTLDQASATQFFLIYSGNGVASDDLIHTIVSYCGGLPLALRVTGAMVSRHRGSLQQIVMIFENHHLSHLHLKHRKDKIVFVALDISVQHLDADDRAKFLELAAFSSFEHGRGKVSRAALGHFWNMSDYDFQLFLDELESRSLLSLTTTRSGTPYIHLHDIMNEYLLESTPERQPLHRQLVEHWRQLMPVQEGPTDWLRYPVPRDPYYFQYLAAHLRSASAVEFDALEANDAFLALSALVSQLDLGLYVEVFPRLFRNSSRIAATVRQLLPLLSLDEKKRLCAVASGKCPGSDEIEAIRLTLVPEINAEYGQHNSHYSQDRSHYDKQREEMKIRQGCDPLQIMKKLSASSSSTPLLPEDVPSTPPVFQQPGTPFVPPKFSTPKVPLDPQVILLLAEAHKKIRTNEVEAGFRIFYRLALMNIPEGMFNWGNHLTKTKPNASAEIEFWYARAAAFSPWVVKQRIALPGVREALHGLALRRVAAGKIQEAIDFYRRAIKERFHFSQHNMGMFYLDGTSIPKNPVKGALLIQDSAIQNNNNAMVSLSHIYAGLCPGFGVNITKSAMWAAAAERSGIDRHDPDLEAVRNQLEMLRSLPKPSLSAFSAVQSSRPDIGPVKTSNTRTGWKMENLVQAAFNTPGSYPFLVAQLEYQFQLFESMDIQDLRARLQVAADAKRRSSIGWASYPLPHLKEAADKLLNSVDPAVACNAAIIYLDKFEGVVETIAYLRDCVRRFPEELFFRRRLAHNLCLNGPLQNHTEAADLYRSLIQKDDLLDDLYHLGVVYFQMEKGPAKVREESESLFAKFLARAPIDHKSRPLVFQFLAMWEFLTQGENCLDKPLTRQKIADLLLQSDAAAQHVHPEWRPDDLPYISLIRQLISAGSAPPLALNPQHGWTPHRIPPSRCWLVRRLNEDERVKSNGSLSGFGSYVPITTIAPRSAVFSSAAEASAKPVSLEEIMAFRQDRVFKNQVFHGIVGSLVLESTNSVYLVALDVGNHLAIELYIYPKTTKLRTQLPIGTRFLLINPYFRLAADGTELLRVDDDRTLKIQSTAPSCWLCFKQLDGPPSDRIWCSSCYVACYCSQQCKTLDSSKLLHAKICPHLPNHGSGPSSSQMPVGSSQPQSSMDSSSRPKQQSSCENPRCSKQGKLQCSRCKMVRYCSPDCQKQDWSKHKQQCLHGGGMEPSCSQQPPITPSAASSSSEEPQHSPAETSFSQQNPGSYLMIDLHGQSELQSQQILNDTLRRSAGLDYRSIRFVTGRGNHLNAKKKRGTLYQNFLGWVQASPFSHRVSKCEQHDGYFEVRLAVTSTSDQGSQSPEDIVQQKYDDFITENIDLIRQHADAGNHQAQFSFAKRLESGFGIAQNFKEAARYYRLAAENQNTLAMHELARCYLHGVGLRQDDREAFLWLEKAAKLADPESMTALGDRYMHGQGVKHDAGQGVSWYLQAAEGGSTLGMRKLASAYNQGVGISQDNQAGILWSRKAADLGDVVSQYNMGQRHLQGVGVDRDFTLAMHYLELAANGGDPEAQNLLGNVYWTGQHRPRDRELAFKWFQKAADAGSCQANLILADHGPEDQRESHLKNAADAGDIVAKARLCSLKSNNGQTLENILRRVARESFHLTSQEILLLGTDSRRLLVDYMLLDGKRPIKQKALQTLEWMAEGNCTFSIRRLIKLYLEGFPSLQIQKNVQKSLSYLHQGRKLGDSKAMFMLGELYEKGEAGIRISLEQALAYYTEAMEGKHPKACFQIGQMHKNVCPEEIYHFTRYALDLEKDDENIAHLDSGPMDRYLHIFGNAPEIGQDYLKHLRDVVRPVEERPPVISPELIKSFSRPAVGPKSKKSLPPSQNRRRTPVPHPPLSRENSASSSAQNQSTPSQKPAPSSSQPRLLNLKSQTGQSSADKRMKLLKERSRKGGVYAKYVLLALEAWNSAYGLATAAPSVRKAYLREITSEMFGHGSGHPSSRISQNLICDAFVLHELAKSLILDDFSTSFSPEHEKIFSLICKRALSSNLSSNFNLQDVYICHCYTLIRNTQSAIKAFTACTQRFPRNPWFVAHLGSLYIESNNVKTGRLHFSKALQLIQKLPESSVDPFDDDDEEEDNNQSSALFKPMEWRIKFLLAVYNPSSIDAIASLHQFLQDAPQDHRSIPDAYYAIALRSIPPIADTIPPTKVSEIVSYYQAGLAAEQQAIPMFLPYQSTIKPRLQLQLLDIALDCRDLQTLDILAAQPDLIVGHPDPEEILLLASQAGHEEIVRLIISTFPKLNIDTVSPEGFTALHVAAFNGHLAVLNLLISARAFVDVRDRSGKTPLILAACKGHTSIVQALISSRTDIEAVDADNQKAIFLAVQHHHLHVVQALVAAGARTGDADSDGNTPLFVAAMAGDTEIVQTLLTTPIDAQAGPGFTPMMAACQGGHIEIVRLLIAHGVDINFQISWKASTALIVAAGSGRREIAMLLIASGADMDTHRSDGATPLMLAAEQGHADVVTCMIKAGASINLRGEAGTALWVAAFFGHESTVRLLLEAGADQTVICQGLTARETAVFKNYDSIVQVLDDAMIPARSLCTIS